MIENILSQIGSDLYADKQPESTHGDPVSHRKGRSREKPLPRPTSWPAGVFQEIWEEELEEELESALSRKPYPAPPRVFCGDPYGV